MKLVELYCQMRGHRLKMDYIPVSWRGMNVSSQAHHCVRCHENLWIVSEL